MFEVNDLTTKIIRRTEVEIILRVLECCGEPTKKTHILYKAGINFYQLTNYMSMLTRLGMVEVASVS